MNDKTITVNEMIGEKAREIESIKSQMAAYCGPLKEKMRGLRDDIQRLVLEDGRQIIDASLFQVLDDE